MGLKSGGASFDARERMDDVRQSMMEGSQVVSSRAKNFYKDFLCRLERTGAAVELKWRGLSVSWTG